MFAKIARGISMPLNSFAYISQKNLWGYTILPLLLTAVVVAILAFVLWFYVLGYVSNLIAVDVSEWPAILRWLFSAFQIIMKIVIFYLLFSLLMRLYLALFSIVVIPFLSPLVEKILKGEGVDTLQIKSSEMIGYIFSSIVYSVKMLIWQIFVSVLLIFTGPLQPFLNFGFSSYFLGRSYFDYVFEMLGRPPKFGEMAKSYRMEATGLGVFSNVFVLIPFVGAVFAPVLCVVAATRLFAERKDV